MDYTMITGATGKLGACFALESLCRGEALFLTGRSADKLEELKDYLLTVNPEAEILYFACDLTDEAQRSGMYSYAQSLEFSRLINAAGADIQKPFSEYTQDKLTFQIRACFEGEASVCLFAVGHRAQKLKIINVSSVSGIYPMPYFALYSSSKAALTQLSVALNKELKGQGVTVTAVLPGAIYTRRDVVENIATQGVWGKIAAKTPQFVVKKAFEASDKGKPKVIVGGANKIMAVFTRLIPPSLREKYIAGRWSKTRKDAF